MYTVLTCAARRCHEKCTAVSTLAEVMRQGEACVVFEGQYFHFRHAPAHALAPGEVVDTTGCGDAFTAACIFWLSREGWQLKQVRGRLPFRPLTAASRCRCFASPTTTRRPKRGRWALSAASSATPT